MGFSYQAATVSSFSEMTPAVAALAAPAVIDGAPGVLVMVGGRPVMVMAFTVTGGAITVICMLTDPDRLAQAVPSWVA